jgi:hypothetical protein
MSAISAVGKVAYIYDQPNDTWHPVAGYANTTETYTWSGRHNFNNTVNFNSVLNAKAGVNNFLDEETRDKDFLSAEEGAVCFIRSLNQIQYRSNGRWRVYGDNANLMTKSLGGGFGSSNYVLEASDAGKTILVNSDFANVITIPENVTFPIGTQIAFIQSGFGQTSFTVQGSTLRLVSKNENRKIAAQHSPATLIKTGEISWTLIGDLTR